MADPIKKTHGTPNWADCACHDLAEAEAFYNAVFGWTAEHAIASDGAVYSIQRLNGKMVAGIYELNEEMHAMNVPPHWGTYFEVKDVAETLKAAEKAGGKIVEAPSSEPNVGTFGVVQDNVGAFLRLWTSAPAHGGEVFNIPGAMTWNELCTKEPEKAATFYEEVFGIEVQTMPDPSDYRVLKVDGREVAGILRATPEMGDMPPTWDVYFASEDVDATAQAVRGAGGSVLREPFDIPAVGARMAVLQDPQGAVFEVISTTMQPT